MGPRTRNGRHATLAALGVGLALALGAAGCGSSDSNDSSSQSDPAAVVKTFWNGVRDGDNKVVCPLLSPALAADKNSAGQDCEHTALTPVPGAKVKISKPTVTGNRATVVVALPTGRSTTMELTKTGDKWTITKTGINGS